MSSALRSVPETDAGGGKLALERSEKSAPSGTVQVAQPKRDEICVREAEMLLLFVGDCRDVLLYDFQQVAVVLG